MGEGICCERGGAVSEVILWESCYLRGNALKERCCRVVVLWGSGAVGKWCCGDVAL